jgi:hypothetical protein
LTFCRFPEVGFRVLLSPELARQMPLDTTFGNSQSFGNVSTAKVDRFFPTLQDFLPRSRILIFIVNLDLVNQDYDTCPCDQSHGLSSGFNIY